MNRELDSVTDPWERLTRFVAALIRFATNYPDHYSLIFLVRHYDQQVIADRERLGQEFVARIRPIVQVLLPLETPDDVIDMRVRQMLTCLHGSAALLLAHPKAYGLTKRKAIEDTEATLRHLFSRSE